MSFFKMNKKTTVIILINILIPVVFFGLLELLIRFSYPEIQPAGTDKNLFGENKYFSSMGLKPNSEGLSNGKIIHTDEFGFRKSSVPLNQKKRSRVFLGDSVTLGIGVEDDSTFAARIQNQNPDFNVINCSLIGYDISDYENLTDYFATGKSGFQVESITIFWCLNDIYGKSVNSVELPGGNARNYFGEILSFLRTQSRLFLFAKKMFTDRPKSYYEFDLGFYQDSTKLNSAVFDIQKMDSLCKSQNIEFNIVFLPYEFQLRSDYSNSPTPQQILVNGLSKVKVKSTDLLPFFKTKNEDPEKFFLFGDGIHFSDYGHFIVSEFMMNMK